MICDFSKCDGFKVLLIISIKYCGISLRLFCNHGNLILKLRKKSYLNEMCLFIGCFKVGSLTRMINKELLAQVICKPTQPTEKIFDTKELTSLNSS